MTNSSKPTKNQNRKNPVRIPTIDEQSLSKLILSYSQDAIVAYEQLVGIYDMTDSKLIIEKYNSYNDRQFTVDTQRVLKVLKNNFKFKIKMNSLNQRELYINVADNYYHRVESFLGDLMKFIFNYAETHPHNLLKRELTMKKDFTSLISDVLSQLKHDTTSIEILKPLDLSTYLVCESGIYKRDDLTKSKFDQFKQPKPVQLTGYDIIDPLPFSIMSDEEYYASENLLYITMFERVLDNWFYDYDKQTVLDAMRATLEKDNREKAMFLRGDGANGKSSFIELLIAALGSSRAVQIDINDFHKSSSIYKIEESTHLIYSTESEDGYINKEAWNVFKKLLMGESVDTFVKYKNNVEIKSHAMQIYASNSQTKIPENNNASLRRLLNVKFKDITEQDRDESIDLKALLKNKQFIEVCANYVFRNTENFKQYSLSEEMQKENLRILNEADLSFVFIDEDFDNFDGIQKIPYRVLFKRYEKWCNSTSRKNTVKTQQAFIKQVTKHLESRGYYPSNTQEYFNLRSSTVENMLAYVVSLTDDDFTKANSNYFEKQSGYITEQHLENVRAKLNQGMTIKQFNKLSNSDKICVEYLATTGHTTAMQLVN